ITLDPATAHPELLLSPDLRSLLLADSPQTLPPDPRRFTESTSALSSQSFSAGSAYWEVTVGDRAVGMLGVCRESVQRQGPLAVSPSAGFWAVKVGGGGALAALSSPPVAVEVRTAPRAIGVLLEHEAGVVSFYNVSDGSHMFTFSDEFGEPL
ncbi:ERMAP protein, partial [Alectura lathami]|nr:ERMAP protein [Alectura lathami]